MVTVPVIRLENLTKTFRVAAHRRGLLGALRSLVDREHRVVRAVDGISLAIEPGELVGYLGPNGAGKSTTIKMLTGILVPTSGLVEVAGFVPWRDRVRYVRRIGVVFGQRTNLWWDLPVVESFELLRHIYRVPAPRFAANLARFEALLGLREFQQTPVRQLSLGQRMRADLAAALLHDPEIVFLDEPTIGLDVVAKERIRGFIREINRERGVTIILTTHDLGDVEKLCRRVILIADGHLMFDGALADLHAQYGDERELVLDLAAGDGEGSTGRLVVDVDGSAGSPTDAELAVPGAILVRREGLRVSYRFRRSETSASELIGRVAERFRIVDLTVREPDIEATVRRIYEERGVAKGGPLAVSDTHDVDDPAAMEEASGHSRKG